MELHQQKAARFKTHFAPQPVLQSEDDLMKTF